jgi:putative transposase
VAELCRQHGFSETSYYKWKAKFGGMDVSDAKRLRNLEAEPAQFKKLLAESLLDAQALKVALRRKH